MIFWKKKLFFVSGLMVLFLFLSFTSEGAELPQAQNLELLNRKVGDFSLRRMGGAGNNRLLNIEHQGFRMGISFFVGEEDETVLGVEVTYYEEFHSVGWYPWFDQEEGAPATVMVDGQIYSQQVYFAHPATDFERLPWTLMSYLGRGGRIALGEKVPLNFYTLRGINPALEYYKKMESPFIHDGSMVFYSPPGPGVGFLVEEGGDVYAAIYIYPADAGYQNKFCQEKDAPLYHPELGKFYSVNILLREKGNRFQLAQGIIEEEDEPQPGTEIEGLIYPGFTCQEISFSQLHGMLKIDGVMKNKSGENYSMAAFSIVFFDKSGNVIAEGVFGIPGFSHGEEGLIHAVIIPQGEMDWDNLIFEIKVEQLL